MSARRCGSCRACCTVLAVTELAKQSFTKCANECESGCSAYEQRPQGCADYRCGWLDGFGDERDRPNRLGVIFDRPARHGGAVVAREVWRGALEEKRVVRHMERLHAAGVRVLLMPHKGRRLAVGRAL